MVAVTDCKLWVMERAVYNAIKRTHLDQIAALRRKMVSSVPMLAVLSEVRLDDHSLSSVSTSEDLSIVLPLCPGLNTDIFCQGSQGI